MLSFFNVKRWGCIGLLAGLVIIMGCGPGTDFLEEVGYRYTVQAYSTKDRGTATTDVDIWQDCDNDYANGDDGEDPTTKTTVTFTFKSNSDMPDIWIYRFKIEYELIEAEGYPANTPSISTNTFDQEAFIPGDGNTSTATIDLLTSADKEAFQNLVGKDDDGLQTLAVFQVHVTAYLTSSASSPETIDEIHSRFTINVGNYQHSSCTAD